MSFIWWGSSVQWVFSACGHGSPAAFPVFRCPREKADGAQLPSCWGRSFPAAGCHGSGRRVESLTFPWGLAPPDGCYWAISSSRARGSDPGLLRAPAGSRAFSSQFCPRSFSSHGESWPDGGPGGLGSFVPRPEGSACGCGPRPAGAHLRAEGGCEAVGRPRGRGVRRDGVGEARV